MNRNMALKRVIITGIIIILGLATIFIIGLSIKLHEFSKEISQIEIENIDVSTIEDGEYIGEYYLSESVGAKVEVTVNNNEIVNIDFIEHKCARGKKAEAITINVIDSQSLDVDAISGATGSSTVILKAIENALSNEPSSN